MAPRSALGTIQFVEKRSGNQSTKSESCQEPNQTTALGEQLRHPDKYRYHHHRPEQSHHLIETVVVSLQECLPDRQRQKHRNRQKDPISSSPPSSDRQQTQTEKQHGHDHFQFWDGSRCCHRKLRSQAVASWQPVY